MKRPRPGAWPLVALAALLLVSLVLLSDATQNSARFGQLYSLLLGVNVLGLLILVALIGVNLARLIHQVRTHQAGARLTVRMVTLFVVLAVTPVLVVYYFSLKFLLAGIDSWFNVRVDTAMEDSLQLSRTSLSVRMRELLKRTEMIATDLSSTSTGDLPVAIDDARRRSGATELTLMSAKGRIIVSSNIDPTAIIPHRPSDTTLQQVRQSGPYIGLDPISGLGLHVRVVVSVPIGLNASGPRVLQALYPITEHMSQLADKVQRAYAQYRELAYLRRPLKISFTLTLSLVLLLSLLTAVWAAFFSARRIVAPLKDLAEGTRAVASGDFETQLPETGKDEIGFLLESFNDMTRRLSRAREDTRQSQAALEEQRRYLQTVLSNLSAGVMTLDHRHCVVTTNRAAEELLGVELSHQLGRPLAEICEHHPHLAPIWNALTAHAQHPESGWREEIVLFGSTGRQVLKMSNTRLDTSEDTQPGQLLVFDDLTALIQAQKNAAWSEVARRLAHEIKNPLTPIQLSAERLRHKYLDALGERQAKVFDRLTRTIVQQVEAMQEMVNAFSEYARTPEMHPRRLNLNDLVADVAELYRGGHRGWRVVLSTDPELPALHLDPHRMRQVLHNLIKNALDTGEQGVVEIATRSLGEAPHRFVELRIRDHGSGFPAEIIERVFEPYVTTKPRGTGLGLAIVKKIVEEHGGVVWAENHAEGGASVAMRFPVAPQAAQAPAVQASTTEVS